MGASIYIRDPHFYPGSDPLGYAIALGCDGVCLQPRIRAHRETLIGEARARGLRVDLYDLPSEYMPDNWAATLERAAELARAHPGTGVLVDFEVVGEWLDAGIEHRALAARMGELAEAGVRMGLTTFPANGLWDDMAADFRRGPEWVRGVVRELREGVRSTASAQRPVTVYGSVQLFGRQLPRDRYLPTLRAWREAYTGGVQPTIALDDAGRWAFTHLADYRDYLSDMARFIAEVNRTPGAHPKISRTFFWHDGSPPDPDSAWFRACRDFVRGLDPVATAPTAAGEQRSTKGTLLWLGICAVVAAAATAATVIALGGD